MDMEDQALREKAEADCDASDENLVCDMCETKDALVFCEGCASYYCDDCWQRLRSHRVRGQGASGVPHGKSKPEVVRAIKVSMSEPQDEREEKSQHIKDENSIWFGLSQDDGGDPALADYRRYASIMMENAGETSSPRFPGLVSFIGPTSSGKSTLIRLLIDSSKRADEESAVSVPVIGRTDCDTPTSADVHLYMDPETSSGTRPILFADCEGFEGGERSPIAQAATSAVQAPSPGYRIHDLPKPSGQPLQDFKRATHAVTKRVIRWASRNSQQHEKTSKRGYAVSEMYPRIFHAFSDVIVFVLNNPKTMEDVVEKLLQWARSNYSASINMPCKPHAIIAINKSPGSSQNEHWFPAQTTKDFFKAMDPQLTKNPTFKRYAEEWRLAKKPIYRMQELFEQYYWTVTVVKLPEKSRYALMHQQRNALREVVNECCEKSLEKRQDLGMLPDVDEFGMYLSLAFDHFSQTLDEPFDYVKASIQNRPPPSSLKDNIFEFVILAADFFRLKGDVFTLFNTITKIVASYFMLDSARQQRLGQPQDWFEVQSSDPSENKEQLVSFHTICQAVLKKYFDFHVPCEYTQPRTVLSRGFKCELVPAAHSQDDYHRQSRKGMHTTAIYASKGYEHMYYPPDKEFPWHEQILKTLRHLHSEYADFGTDTSVRPREKTARGHQRQLKQFYSKGHFYSNRICLGCIFNPPTYRLHCGHIICLQCVLDFGQPRLGDDTQISVENCPVCPTDSRDQVKRMGPDIITIDLVHSGLRVLVLDGGGVRGIVELCVLKAIEDELHGIPLQRFFDLIVGTSTGGILALGFGHKLWSIDECIGKFTSLVRVAFTARPGQKYEGFKYFEQLFRQSKYRSGPLRNALKDSFGLSPLFAPTGTSVEPVSDLRSLQSSDSDSFQVPKDPIKVAVTTVSEAGKRAYLLSNYNVGAHCTSSDSKMLQYSRHRPATDQEEFLVWEAARATSAAPGFFKPFEPDRFSPSTQYMDGALLHNNPIQIAIEEARRLAIERNLHSRPDIVLSLGTGQSKDQPAPEDWARDFGSSGHIKFTAKALHQRQKLSLLPMLFTIVKHQLKMNLDCEKRFEQVRQEYTKESELSRRLHRLNPYLGAEPPLLDAVDKVDLMLNNTRGWTQREEARAQIHDIACKLLASSFYFQRIGGPGKAQGRGSPIQLRGIIKCRLTSPSEVMALGRFFAKCSPVPTFVLINYVSADQEVTIPVDVMESQGHFGGVEVRLTVPGEDAVASIELKLERPDVKNRRLFRLSGFPRKLVKEDYSSSI